MYNKSIICTTFLFVCLTLLEISTPTFSAKMSGFSSSKHLPQLPLLASVVHDPDDGSPPKK
jgi:hypothetical protein